MLKIDNDAGTWNRRNNSKNNGSMSFSSFVAFGRWNVVFASTKTQTYGDYVDIELPNYSSYPNLYVAFVLLVKVWQTKTRPFSK